MDEMTMAVTQESIKALLELEKASKWDVDYYTKKLNNANETLQALITRRRYLETQLLDNGRDDERIPEEGGTK